MRIPRYTLLLLVLSTGSTLADELPASRVADLVPSSKPVHVSPRPVALVDDQLYFVGSTEATGRELFHTDGTPEGTELVADFCPGRCSGVYDALPTLPVLGGATYVTACGEPGCGLFKVRDGHAEAIYTGDGPEAVVWKGELYFAADGELRRSDGSDSGTVLHRFEGYRRLKYLLPTDDVLYFVAAGYDGGLVDPPIAPPSQLWRTDGTPEGTWLLSDPGSQPFLLGQKVVFLNEQLMTTDGQDVEPLLDPQPFGNSFRILEVIDGYLYLVAAVDIWRTDGTPEGTRIMSGTADPSVTAAYRGELYFYSLREQSRLWRVPEDASGAVEVVVFPEDIQALDVSGDTLFVSTGQDDSTTAIWRSEGTAGSTRQVAAVREGAVATFLAALDGDPVVRINETAGDMSSLVRYTAGEEVSLFRDEAVSGDPRSLTPVDGHLFFLAHRPQDEQEALWRSHVRSGRTVQLAANSEPSRLLGLDGRALVFEETRIRAFGTSSRRPVTLFEEPAEARQILLGSLTTLGEEVLFLVLDGVDLDLWRTDGTRNGTVVLSEAFASINFFGLVGKIRGVALGNEVLWFIESKIWRTDGTAEGTVEVADTTPDCPYCESVGLVATSDLVFFVTDSYESGKSRLWRTDATTEGTFVVLELESGSTSVPLASAIEPPRPSDLVAVGERVFFVVSDPWVGEVPILPEPQLAAGTELWVSDGTPEGTRMVRDIRPGRDSSEPRSLSAFRGRVVFSADDGVAGRELWASDGTAEGTVRLHDLAPGAMSSSPHNLRAVGDVLLMAATGDAAGDELWASDGTTAWRVQDLHPGPAGSDPREATLAGDRVFFNAGDAAGFELWSMPVAALEPPAPACASCVLDGRFDVSVEWKNHDGSRQGLGTPVPVTDRSVAFWFFNASNLELVVKVLDGRAINGELWVFWGALTDVEYTIRVEDRETGDVRTYHNPAGHFCGGADTGAFSGLRTTGLPAAKTPVAGTCVAGPETLCLHENRFRVEVDWRVGSGRVGKGRMRPATRESGFVSFFDEDNVELVVKVLDGRDLNGHFWFFAGSLTTVEHDIRVTDTVTGESRTFSQPAGANCGFSDTRALSGVPTP